MSNYFYTYAAHVGNNIHYRYVENGVRHTKRIPYSPTLFIPARNESKYRTIDGQPVEPINFETMRDSKQFCTQYADVDGFKIFGNTDYRSQFIGGEFSGHVAYDPALIRGFNLDIETPSLDEEGNSMGFPDAQKAEFEVKSIALRDSFTNTYYGFGLKDFEHDKNCPEIGHLDIRYMKCRDEIDLLTKFLKFWNFHAPDYVTGWNIEGFDIPYLVNRIKKVLGEDMVKMLSPFKTIYERTFKDAYMNEVTTYEIGGVATLDYIDLYKKHTYVTRESYKLDFIAHAELGDRKMDYSEAGTLNKLYILDPQKFMAYNFKDVDIVQRLDDKLKLIDITFTLAYYAKINYKETLSPVKFWDNLIYHDLNDKNIVIPFKQKHTKPDQYAGAFVMAPIVGKHKWVVSFDLNSLYPHLIQQYNIGPETLIDASVLPDCARVVRSQHISVDALLQRKVDTSALQGTSIGLAANGQFFRNDEMSFLSRMMRELYAGRKADKKQMLKYEQELVDLERDIREGKFDGNQIEADTARKKLKNLISQYDNLQMAKKIALNSAYGALGNTSFRFYDLRLAEAITLSGQLSIRWVGVMLDEYFNKLLGTNGQRYVIYTDTDSVYICLDKLVARAFPDQSDTGKIVDFLDNVCANKIQPVINDCYGELAEYMNAYEQRMFMGREIISEAAIWTAKKRYCMRVWDSEGVRFDKPKLKIMGLEAVKSSTPEHCRGALKECYDIALSRENDDLITFIDLFRKKFMKMPVEDIAFPRSCNNLAKYADNATIFKKGTPAHVKGTLLYNHLLDKAGLVGELESVKEGDKIKFVNLKDKNPTKVNTLSFPDYLDERLKMHRFIDYETMFDKSFLKPLSPITDALKWHTEETVTLDDFF